MGPLTPSILTVRFHITKTFTYLSIHETVKQRHDKPLQHKRHCECLKIMNLFLSVFVSCTLLLNYYSIALIVDVFSLQVKVSRQVLVDTFRLTDHKMFQSIGALCHISCSFFYQLNQLKMACFLFFCFFLASMSVSCSALQATCGDQDMTFLLFKFQYVIIT